jgi:hypothetical protein
MDTKEWRNQLRGAVRTGNGPAVVAHVGRGPMPEEPLQLIGDGLLAALAQGVDGADDLAGDCLNALRQRDWYGDDTLADQLAAALGEGPTPMLRPLPVPLDELADILEGDPMLGGGRIDLRTGEVWHRAVIEYEQEMGNEDPDEDEDPDRWLYIECEGSRYGYRDMEMFIGTLSNEDRADRLEIAIQGRGAFRRFRDVLARWPDELDRWYAFSEDRQRGRAREWLAAAGYRPTIPSKPAP